MAQSNTRLSPRQKMINLMYIVLTAMLALNVSSDVLDGFAQVEAGLQRTNATVSQRNDAIYAQLSDFASQNPEKAAQWLEKATEVRDESNRLYNLIDDLKLEIAREADGPEANLSAIENREDLEAASVVMLSPSSGKGEKLRGEIDAFRSYIKTIVTDSAKNHSIDEALSTAPFRRPGVVTPQTWEEAKFENQPVVAAITLLTKLQNDVRYAEGEALSTLLSMVDAGDVRVNELNAFVIPQSRLVMRGGRYSADIVLAAVDTTQRPRVYINGKEVAGGHYEFTPGSSGSFDYSGYLEVPRGDGSMTRHEFRSDYTVIEPTATVSATMMNVFYAGIDNPISISVPGVPAEGASASMTNGSLTRSGDHWIARPGAVGTEAKITVTATIDGKSQTVNTTSFRVRKLPDPVAFIPYTAANGTTEHYKGGRPLSKAALINAKGLGAAIDDDILKIDFHVLGFDMVYFDQMGNAMTRKSDGANFSAQQQQVIRGLSRGKIFYLSNIRAKGPDGIERLLSPVEVRVN